MRLFAGLALAIALTSVSCGKPDSKPAASKPDSASAPDSARAVGAAGAATGNSRVVAPPNGCGAETVTGQGVAKVRIGATVNALRAECEVVRDTTMLDIEGMPARRVSVALSRDTVVAEIVDGKVWRINVNSPGLRTADSIGVGTSIARLRQLKNPRVLTGEGSFFVVSPDLCGLSLQLRDAGPLRATLALKDVPSTARVSHVLVIGCRGPASAGG